MLVLLLTWLNISLVSLGFGMILNRLLKQGPASLEGTLIQGLILSIALAEWISLLFPVNSLLNLVFSLVALSWILFNRRQIPLPEPVLFKTLLFPGFLLLLVHSLIMANAFPVLPDTWFYHSQSVKWIEQYPVIPGLGNFFSNLAYNSSVFAGNALFSPRWMIGYPAFPVNSYLWILSLLVLLKQTSVQVARKNYAVLIPDWVMLLLLYRYFHPVLSTSSQDPAAAWLLFIAWMHLNDTLNKKQPAPALIPLIMIAGFLPTVKLSHALLALPALLWSFRQSSPRLKVASLLLIAGITLPWILRNLVLSGYPFYPVAWPDILQADWKIPVEDLDFEQKLIRSWASDPALPLDGNQDFFSFSWVSGWLSGLGWFNLGLLGAWIFSLGLLCIRSYRRFLSENSLRSWILCLYASLAIWFLSAPSLRFVLGILMLSLMIPLKWFVVKYVRIPKITPVVISFYVLLAFSFSAARTTTGEALSRQGSLVAPLPPPEPRVREVRLNTVDFYYIDPRDLKAFDHALPCSPQYREGLILRGKSLKDGFRIDPELRKGGPESIRHFYESRDFTGDTRH